MRPNLTKSGLNAAISAYEQWVDTQIEVPYNERKKAVFIDSGKVMHCGKGCTRCCELLVTICSPDALRIGRFLKDKGMDTPELRHWLREDTEFLYALAKEHKTDDKISEAYVSKHRPCRFLKDGGCSIYEARPVVCRIFNSLEPAEKCMGENRNTVERLRADDLKEMAGHRGAMFANMSWTPEQGVLSEMVLWALEAWDWMEAKS